jgi:hypothetical protein
MVVVEIELSSSLNVEDWQAVTRYVLENLTIERDGQRIRSLPKVLNTLGQEHPEAASRIRALPVPHAGFGEAMRRALDMSEIPSLGRDLLGRFLVGERVSTVQLRRSSVPGVKAPLSGRNAEHALNTVITMLHAIGVPGTMLCFDEHEKTFQYSRRRPPRRITIAANLIRRLIDACPMHRVHGMVAIFAVLPNFLRTCAEAYPALGQRLEVDRSEGVCGWRWPVLPIAELTTVDGPEEFLEEAAHRFSLLVEQQGVPSNGLRHELRKNGRSILELHAGSGFRRPLMKQLASITLRRLED